MTLRNLFSIISQNFSLNLYFKFSMTINFWIPRNYDEHRRCRRFRSRQNFAPLFALPFEKFEFGKTIKGKFTLTLIAARLRAIK